MAKTKPAMAMTDADYQCKQDAHTLQEAQEIRNDKPRHTKALTHLKKEAGAATDAVAMEKRVKKGLAAAFPKDGDKGNY